MRLCVQPRGLPNSGDAMPFSIIAGPSAKTTTQLIAELEAAGVWIPGISLPIARTRRLRAIGGEQIGHGLEEQGGAA